MVATQRKYTAQFKTQVVLEVIRGEKSSADACRTHKIHSSECISKIKINEMAG